MTAASSRGKSLEQLERETERNRAALAGTVDTLRETVLDEVGDIRRKMSVEYIKSEVSGYARETSTAWVTGLQGAARAHPLRSLAIGAGLGLPLLRMARHVPLPLLVIGAGFALARPTGRNAVGLASAKVGGGAASVRTGANDLIARAQGAAVQAGGSVTSTASSAWTSTTDTAAGAVASIKERASDLLDAGVGLKSQAAEKGRTTLDAGYGMLSDARDQTGQAVTQAGTKAVDFFHTNPLLVAGAGVALGALFAAILPATQSESRLLSNVAPDLKQKATDLVDQGYEAASSAASDIYNGLVGQAKDKGLSVEGASDAAHTLGEKVQAVVEAAVGGHRDTPAPETKPVS